MIYIYIYIYIVKIHKIYGKLYIYVNPKLNIYLQYFFTVFIFFIFYAKNPIVISVISEVTNRAKVDI